MKFFSNLENEYNDILGETAQNEDEDSSKGPDDKEDEPDGDASFTGMLSDIKKDLNTIPKEEVFPAFPSGKKKGGKSDLVEESEFDVSDARKAVKSADLKRKREKRCKVGDKFYDIGERWEDEKTGKEMICILMNIPKDVQPSLAEADVTLSVDEPRSEDWSRPSVEPQWAYTAQPKKKTEGDSTKCKSDDEEKQSEKEKPTDDKEELRKGEGIKQEGADDKIKEQVKSKTAKKSGKEKKSGKVPTEKKGKKPNKKLPKEKNTKETSPVDEKKDGIEQSGDGSQDKRDSKPIEEDKKVKSKLPDKKVSPGSLKKETKPETSSKYVETDNVESKIRGKEGNKDSTSELEQKDDKSSPVKNDENEEKDVINNLQPPGKTNDKKDDLTTTTQNEQDQVKGEPIFMKETVVKRRRLLRTEETIQTTTTDKTSTSK